MLDLSSLNENQLKAVTWNDGPLLVLAGPGSGKTPVLAFRIARILEETKGQHFRILALTFTNKATAEMRNRLESLVPDELNRVRLTTFHSYAAEILQQHGSHLGLRPDFQILPNDSDRMALLDDVLAHLRKDLTYSLPDSFTAESLLPVINHLLESCIPADNSENFLENAKIINAIPLSRLYRAYREALLRNNMFDFPSLMAESLYLLQIHPFLPKHFRKIYKHVIIDEYEYTNFTQYQILFILAKPDPSTLFIVSDDDQTNYRANSASQKRLKNLQAEFNVTELQLPENYSCPSLAIELANSLIVKNLNRPAVKKPLQTFKTEIIYDKVRLLGFEDVDHEADWISNDISQKSIEDKSGCAVLAGTKKLLDLIAQKMEKSGVSVYYASKKYEFKSAQLRMLLAILSLVNFREDKKSLSCLTKAFYELQGIYVDQPTVIARSSADGNDLLRSWLYEVQVRNSLGENTRAFLETGIQPLLNSLKYRIFADNIFGWAVTCQGKSQGDEIAFNEFEEEREVWKEFLTEITKKFEGGEIGLDQLLHELDLTSNSPPKPPYAVPCLTIPASKGMEFDHVYLMGLVEDQLPCRAAVKKGDESLEMQEERRNCFGAITRTQDSLTLSFSAKVFGQKKQPSRFLAEMGFVF
jgi:DNA helicase-2/ATP-dependent DNA helicase PcrA